MSSVPQEAYAAAAASEDELLLELGAQLAPDIARDGGPEDLRRRAVEWLDGQRASLKELLCGNDSVRALRDEAADVAALADLIAATAGRPPIYTVAAILLKRGLDWVCGTEPG